MTPRSQSPEFHDITGSATVELGASRGTTAEVIDRLTGPATPEVAPQVAQEVRLLTENANGPGTTTIPRIRGSASRWIR